MVVKCPKCNAENTSDSQFCKKCATPLPTSEEVEISHTKTLETPTERLIKGTTFAGRYEIIEELGKGGMGMVYRALDKQINEEVAIKLIKPEIAADENILERFGNELKLARKISHKNVCRMYHLEKEEKSPYITMEYVPGEDLKSVVKRREKISEEEAISIAKQVCEGLREAHELGVIHRDLKPQNIMIDEKGNAKIMDFGIARSLEAPGVTVSGIMIGTPDYISPEQAEGKKADQRSDLYSLGVILYEMVTGNVPFKGDTALSVALKHKAQFPQDPKKLNPGISEDLNRLILVCMEKDQERRYQTAEALLSDLQNIEEGLPLGTKTRPRRKTLASTLIQKKLFIPAVVVALAVIAIAAWQLLPRKEAVPPAPTVPSVAVLPFEDLSPQKDLGHLCDGVPESLIVALHKIEDLRVPASTSSFKFRGRDQDMKEIGEKLNVKTVLKGSLQKSENRIGITAQLVNVADESFLWSEQYDRDLEDIFAIQDEITLAVVDKLLKIKLLEKEKLKLIKRYTDNPEAYELYLKGISCLNSADAEQLPQSLIYFQKAIEKDPNFALAYGGIAYFYNSLGGWGIYPPRVAYPKAKEAAEKALELDDSIGAVFSSYATTITFYDWDWGAAEREHKRAIELSPGHWGGHWGYSLHLSVMGRHIEAIAEIERALELDPLSNALNFFAAYAYYMARDYDKAIQQYKKNIEMDPNDLTSRSYLAVLYSERAMHNEALTEVQRVIDLSKGGFPTKALYNVAHVYLKTGKRDKAAEVLEELIVQRNVKYIPSAYIAIINSELGQKDQAFEWLERAYEEHDAYLVYLKVHPRFDSLRSDPRFQDLLKRMNFP